METYVYTVIFIWLIFAGVAVITTTLNLKNSFWKSLPNLHPKFMHSKDFFTDGPHFNHVCPDQLFQKENVGSLLGQYHGVRKTLLFEP